MARKKRKEGAPYRRASSFSSASATSAEAGRRKIRKKTAFFRIFRIFRQRWPLQTLRLLWTVPDMARRKRSAGTVAPSASDLTTKEAALVSVVVEAAAEGKRFPTRQEIGTRAGYGVGETARVQASRALRRPHVRDAIQAGIRETAGVDVAAAYLTIRNAAAKAPSARDRITAAGKILDIAGMAGAGPQGAGVAIEIVFRSPDAAAMLRAAPVALDMTMQRPALAHMGED